MKTSTLFKTLCAAGIAFCGISYALDSSQPVDDHATTTMTPPLPDDQLSSRIQHNLQGNRNTSEAGKRVNVAVQNARVTLKGAVPSSKEKQQIESSIRQIKGIQELDNQITIIPNHSLK